MTASAGPALIAVVLEDGPVLLEVRPAQSLRPHNIRRPLRAFSYLAKPALCVGQQTSRFEFFKTSKASRRGLVHHVLAPSFEQIEAGLAGSVGVFHEEVEAVEKGNLLDVEKPLFGGRRRVGVGTRTQPPFERQRKVPVRLAQVESCHADCLYFVTREFQRARRAGVPTEAGGFTSLNPSYCV